LTQVKIIEKTRSDTYPLIVPIPDITNPKVRKTDRIVELIKRKTGIEVKF